MSGWQKEHNHRVRDAKLVNALRDAEPVTLTFQPWAVVGIVGTLQLALRHPGNRGPTAAMVRQLCVELIELMPAEARPLLALGFDPQYDRLSQPAGGRP